MARQGSLSESGGQVVHVSTNPLVKQGFLAKRDPPRSASMYFEI
ncbi:hypothetical protein A2U01_0065390, partial [Trifolium medium]|nr:hypothetical protein [Trifolium medium]